jgi:transcription elongation factor Elf1
MSSIFLSQDIAEPENGSDSNDLMILPNPYKHIICGEYSLDGGLLNTSLDAVSGQNSGIQGNYSEILDRLASSLDSPIKFLQDGIYSKQKYSAITTQIDSNYLPHHTEPDSTRTCSSHKQILMSSSSETLFETPRDNLIELNSDNHKIQNSNCKSIKQLKPYISDPSQKVRFLCPIDGCGKVFTRKANGRAHIETHNPNRARPFTCPKCFKSYLRSIDLIRHIDTTHNQTQKHLCSDCGRRFTRKEGLKKHQERGICLFSNFSSKR